MPDSYDHDETADLSHLVPRRKPGILVTGVNIINSSKLILAALVLLCSMVISYTVMRTGGLARDEAHDAELARQIVLIDTATRHRDLIAARGHANESAIARLDERTTGITHRLDDLIALLRGITARLNHQDAP